MGWPFQLSGTVPFEHTQILLLSMALPTSTILTLCSCKGKAIDVPVCLAFGVPNLACYCAGLLFLVHVLVCQNLCVHCEPNLRR